MTSDRRCRQLAWLAATVALVAGGGASCPRTRPAQHYEPPPIAFQTEPTIDQIVAAVNANSAPIRQLQAEGVTLRMQGPGTAGALIPPLRANLAIERPGRMRLQAELSSFTGQELDLGSNDDLAWLWVRRGQPPALYYLRHSDWAASPMRQWMPVEPAWLIEALGVVTLDPAGRHEGPHRLGAGHWEIRSRIASPGGDLTRVLRIDARYGWVVEQHLYDPAGRLAASVSASRHRYYPLAQVSLPQQVELRLPAAEASVQVEIGNWGINYISGDPGQLWAMPRLEGYPLVDMATMLPPATAGGPPVGAPVVSAPPRGYAGPSAAGPTLANPVPVGAPVNPFPAVTAPTSTPAAIPWER